jgi:hypothetical protein
MPAVTATRPITTTGIRAGRTTTERRAEGRGATEPKAESLKA